MSSGRTSERRSVPRAISSGRLAISFTDPVPLTVEAQLLDASPQGLRISHSSKRLVPGLDVQYYRNGKTGRARVIWTHVLDGRWVSGLVIL
jgi:hypothetical protein